MTDTYSPKDFHVTTGPLPASRKVHLGGSVHPFLRVAMREIDLAPASGENPLRIYDTSGLYSDPAAVIDIARGLPELCGAWIRARGDVEAYDGRAVRPEDNGLKPHEAGSGPLFDRAGRQPLRAKPGRAVTQLAYARAGIVTPEMEYIVIRENVGRERLKAEAPRDGESFGAAIPDQVTPESEPMIIGRNFLVKAEVNRVREHEETKKDHRNKDLRGPRSDHSTRESSRKHCVSSCDTVSTRSSAK